MGATTFEALTGQFLQFGRTSPTGWFFAMAVSFWLTSPNDTAIAKNQVPKKSKRLGPSRYDVIIKNLVVNFLSQILPIRTLGILKIRNGKIKH